MTEQERAAPLDVAARACCRPARPVVTVVMPLTAGRTHPVELLLCGHHFRASQASLRAAGAAGYDKTGVPIMTGSRAADVPGPSVGGLVATAHSRRE